MRFRACANAKVGVGYVCGVCVSLCARMFISLYKLSHQNTQKSLVSGDQTTQGPFCRPSA